VDIFNKKKIIYKKLFLSTSCVLENHHREGFEYIGYKIQKYDPKTQSYQIYDLTINTNQGAVLECDENFNTDIFLIQKETRVCTQEIFNSNIGNNSDNLQKIYDVGDNFIGKYQEYIYNASMHYKHFHYKNNCFECYNYFLGPNGQQFYQFIKEVGNVVLESKGLKF